MSPLLLCLAAGHFLAEFGLLPARSTAARNRAASLLRHVAIVVVTFGGACVPFGLAALWPLLAALAIVHAGIEFVATRFVRRPGFLRQGELWVFLAAQALHLFAITAGWRWLGTGATTGSSVVPAALVPLWTQVMWIAGSLALVTRGGLVLVDRTLRQVPVLTATGDSLRTGRIIGILERLLVFFLVAQGEWGAVGLVVAAKSIIRFKDLEQRNFAEYYLIGTLTSLLLAGVAGGLARVILQSL
jgi:hypothetical protein